MSTTRRWVVLAAGLLALAAIVSAAALFISDDDAPADLTVGWGGTEGHPSCVYDAQGGTVDATVTIDGEAPEPDEVTVTITAYADENTSRPVGSVTRSVAVEGTVHLPLVVTIPVDREPHVDEDGETACRLSVD